MKKEEIKKLTFCYCDGSSIRPMHLKQIKKLEEDLLKECLTSVKEISENLFKITYQSETKNYSFYKTSKINVSKSNKDFEPTIQKYGYWGVYHSKKTWGVSAKIIDTHVCHNDVCPGSPETISDKIIPIIEATVLETYTDLDKKSKGKKIIEIRPNDPQEINDPEVLFLTCETLSEPSHFPAHKIPPGEIDLARFDSYSDPIFFLRGITKEGDLYTNNNIKDIVKALKELQLDYGHKKTLKEEQKLECGKELKRKELKYKEKEALKDKIKKLESDVKKWQCLLNEATYKINQFEERGIHEKNKTE